MCPPTTSPQKLNRFPAKADPFPTNTRRSYSLRKASEPIPRPQRPDATPQNALPRHSDTARVHAQRHDATPKTHYPRLEDGFARGVRVYKHISALKLQVTRLAFFGLLRVGAQNRLLNGGIVFHAVKCCLTDVIHARRIARTAGLPQSQPRELGTPVYGSVLRPPFE